MKEILFDFDGVLAHYDSSKEYKIGLYGEPIQVMVDCAKEHIQLGHNVKVFTARLDQDTPEDERLEAEGIMEWCRRYGLVTSDGNSIPVTNRKSRHTSTIYDDRAIAVRKNSGYTLRFEKDGLASFGKGDTPFNG